MAGKWMKFYERRQIDQRTECSLVRWCLQHEEREKYLHSPYYHHCSVGHSQCDQIGWFLMFLATNNLIKVVQIFCDFWGLFEKHPFLSNNCCVYFLGKFCKIWANFYSNILSHWSVGKCTLIEDKLFPSMSMLCVIRRDTIILFTSPTPRT